MNRSMSLLAGMMFVGSLAFAQSGTMSGSMNNTMMKNMEGACAQDIQSFCSGIEPGEGRLMKCLHENKDKLSATCKAQQEKRKQAFKEVKAACHDDVEKFCGDTEPGKGRIMQCMKQHKSELSAGCRAEVDKKKSKRM